MRCSTRSTGLRRPEVDPQEIHRQLDALWNKYLRQLAEEDPTLTRLKEALARGRAIQQQIESCGLLAVIRDLEARYSRWRRA